MPLMEENVKLNALDNVQVAVLDWGEAALPAGIPGQPDIVLLADCVYSEPAFPLLGASATSALLRASPRPPIARSSLTLAPLFLYASQSTRSSFSPLTRNTSPLFI